MQNSADFLDQTLSSCRQAFWYVALFSFFSNSLVLVVPLYMLQLFDRVLVSHSGSTLFYLTLLAMLALLTLAVLDVIRSRMLVVLGHWLDNQLSPETFRRGIEGVLQSQPNPMQSLTDVQQIRSFLANPLSYTLFDVPWVPIFVLIIFFLHPALGWFTLAGALILIGLAFVNQKVTQDLTKKHFVAHQHTQRQLQTAFQNAETIQSMGMLENIIKHWQNKNAKALELSTQSSHRTNIILGISKGARLALQVGILALGAYLVINNEITPGAMITASILLTRVYAPIEQSIAAWRLFRSAQSAYIRLKERFADPGLRTCSSVLQVPEGAIEVEEMSFTPKGCEKPLLQNIAFALKPGELLIIIGASGAGKTTLLRLLAGILEPSEGSVRLDGADVYTWERSMFGRFVGYMPQESELFVGTVQDNIGRMGETDEEAIVTASKLAGAHDFILRLPKAYATELYDAGHRLSGGQRQQLALARALYRFPHLLILDEPSTHLDQQGQEQLLESIAELRQRGCTIILVSHHSQLIRAADKILWLDHGKIKNFGGRESVLSQIPQVRPVSVVPTKTTQGN